MSEKALHLLLPGRSPLVVNVPHAGTLVPETLVAALTAEGRKVPDTDWHVPFLYQYAIASGATFMAATYSRYVVDLNRDPENAALYPGADNTELCPTRTFANEPIYGPGKEPGAKEIETRRDRYWKPYHAALKAEIEAVRKRHGYAVLLDAHSIRAEVPRFFEGRLADLNLGTADSTSCAARLRERVFDVLGSDSAFTRVLDGRFKGGYITRHYGQPDSGVHALQLEIAQDAYMDETAPDRWDAARAQPLMAVLTRLVDLLIAWRPHHG